MIERLTKTLELHWFVEIGFCDGFGIGRWEETKESVEVATLQEGEVLRDKWLSEGKLVKTNWGEIRPTFAYGIFRIRSEWKEIPSAYREGWSFAFKQWKATGSVPDPDYKPEQPTETF
jgi:hypothetical protein